MAPKSQEPQVKTQIVESKATKEKIDYIGIVSFNLTATDKGTISYVVQAENQQTAKSMIENLFEIDFPFDGIDFKYLISVVEVTKPDTQKPTTRYRIKKLLTEFLDDKEKRYPTIKMKVNGELLSIQQIRELLKIKKNVVVVPETKQAVEIKQEKTEVKNIVEEKPIVETRQETITEVVTPKVEQKIKNNKWFCEYNIKIGTQRFRKGTIIEKVDNEVDARKQLDIYIKRNFSKVRSVTKVEIKEFDNEKEYSNEIIEEIKTVSTPTVKVEKEKTLDEILEENFPKEILNTPSIIVAIGENKPKKRDFENDFLVLKDDGQTDEEIFEKVKKDLIHIKRKNIGIKRVKTKNVFETQQYRKAFLSKRFKECIEQGYSGTDALVESLGYDSKDMSEKIQNKLLKEDRNDFLSKKFAF